MHELGEQFLNHAQKQNDLVGLGMAHTVLGIASFWLGQFASAREHLEKRVAVFDSGGQETRDFRYAQDIRMLRLGFRAWTLWHLGYPDQALERIREMESKSRELSHPPSTAMFLVMSCVLHQYLRDVRTTQKRAEALLEISAEKGFSQYRPWGALSQGWAMIEQGGGKEMVEQMSQGLALWQGKGVDHAFLMGRGIIAEAYRKLGLVAEGLEVVQEGLMKTEKTGERADESRLYRLMGEFLLMQPEADEKQAESCFQHALEISRQLGAKLPELQSAMSLCRLWQTQGKKEEAKRLLSDIYGWFTEGFDTADLKDAKSLLEELS
jgi:predicted ATPase